MAAKPPPHPPSSRSRRRTLDHLARPRPVRPARALSPDDPGSGCLVGIVPGQTQQIPIPLEHTEVGANIRGYIGAVGVQQQLHNPFDTKIEAVYVFRCRRTARSTSFS